ncbi:hypothetical protein OFN70_07470 [Campylobacter sp. CN_NE3]|uniref:hypothetical protein n=1 Tax=Campylobacter sp. CN_NE3 TaxID=2984149 RepID=UPI0022EA0C80|nr:hypothetical protein [Campylobacter sp. CN_NE3]MDA3069363.1 hypothetical protein [Campylobacter sp. CN_NE3]
MWEFLKSLGGENGALGGLGSVIGGLGGLYGAYNQQKMAKNNFNLQKEAFNYNKMLSEEERKRRDMTDRAINQAFANSTLSKM